MRNAPFGVGNLVQWAALSTLSIKTAAGTRINLLVMMRIHLNAENVGVVNHAGMNRFPGSASIGGAPWQMRSACVKDVAVGRVDGEGDDGSSSSSSGGEIFDQSLPASELR